MEIDLAVRRVDGTGEGLCLIYCKMSLGSQKASTEPQSIENYVHWQQQYELYVYQQRYTKHILTNLSIYNIHS